VNKKSLFEIIAVFLFIVIIYSRSSFVLHNRKPQRWSHRVILNHDTLISQTTYTDFVIIFDFIKMSYLPPSTSLTQNFLRRDALHVQTSSFDAKFFYLKEC